MNKKERYGDKPSVKIKQTIYSIFFLASWALAIYAFLTGNVWGGFGIALLALLIVIFAGIVGGIVRALDDKYLWDAALKEARKEVEKEKK